ncbi:tryptophan transporter [Bacillus massiliglaciei]|uniref:tryptophan transporter n=1 Tax=Bacillus massiliglaciei TaxID=1816693 RepID=UPI000DA60E95|nr:tryptophan transporter [Bacillus massiliglaciei]
MNTKTLVSMSLFVGIGAALHFIIPGFFFSMKPDMMLLMMFLAIALFPEKKNVFILALASGVISGISTAFPGGLFPNIIDKFVTAFVFFALFLVFRKAAASVTGICVLTVIGTLVSGTVFLTSAYFIVGLPGPFLGLFSMVVLPAVLLNTIAIAIIYPIVKSIFQRTNQGTKLVKS